MHAVRTYGATENDDTTVNESPTPPSSIARLARGITLGAAILFAAGDASAQRPENPRTMESREDVTLLLPFLGSEAHDVRERITDVLMQKVPLMNDDERAIILEAAISHDDPEIRLRADYIAKMLKQEELRQSPTVTLPQGPTLTSNLFKELCEKTGNRLKCGNKYALFNDVPVTLGSANAGTFWDMTERICMASNNKIRDNYDTSDPCLVVTCGDVGRAPRISNGPVAGRILSARRVFIEKSDFEDAQSEITHTFKLEAEIRWEDRINVLAMKRQPELISVITEQGDELFATCSSNDWISASTSKNSVSYELPMQPPNVASGFLKMLAIKWEYIAGCDYATMDMRNLQSSETQYAKTIEASVASFQDCGNNRYECVVEINRDLPIPKPEEILFNECIIQLIDTAGTPIKKVGQSNSRTGGGARLHCNFMHEGSGEKASFIRIIYPRIRSAQAVGLRFPRVPLPASHPQ